MPFRQRGSIAQLARACGSYPQCRWFESNCRYHKAARWSSGLRHRPFTAVTRVRFPFGSPLFGRIAQLVRALASHARGQRFESVCAHQKIPVRWTGIFYPSRRLGISSTTALPWLYIITRSVYIIKDGIAVLVYHHGNAVYQTPAA